MSGISLTASMRSNLLSLQNIASQQDIVQNRLATGLKVSSAIDNPSSYYTASSLNNRAADLTALLDAMSQGIQTIKAASEAIDSGTKFLEQAKAVANQALESAQPVIARVSSETELLTAVETGQKGLIVVENDITMNTNVEVRLQAGQSLVGARYLDKSAAAVTLHFNFDDNAVTAVGVDLNQGSLLADINIDYSLTDSKDSTNFYAVRNWHYTDVKIHNVNINASCNGTSDKFVAALRASEKSIDGTYVFSDTTLSGTNNFTINAPNKTTAYALAGPGKASSSMVTLAAGSLLNLSADRCAVRGSRIEVNGEMNIKTSLAGAAAFNGGSLQINKTGKVLFQTAAPTSKPFTIGSLKWEKGARLGLSDTVKDVLWRAESDKLDAYVAISSVASQDFAAMFPGEWIVAGAFPGFSSQAVSSVLPGFSDNTQYLQIIEQYNQLMNDSSYKGINLLTGQNLKVNFNEDRSSKIEVSGVKADSDSLGLRTKEWKAPQDIEKSISELETAINSLRGFASEFGNYYSIVTTRQDFTENLINVLTEGVDKLTLADMNQESANMLALQTSQQLAVNSLSLASQASQAVLKLF